MACHICGNLGCSHCEPEFYDAAQDKGGQHGTSTNTARDEIATRLLKRWVAVWDNDDPEFNDIYLHKETLEFINSVATSPVA